MNASLIEHKLGGLRWIVLNGPDREAFRALGEHVRGEMAARTIDHLPVAAPGDGAGRHFVGRGLQRSARTIDEAIDYLRAHPAAGGFAYTIGDPAGRVVSVEAAAGRHAFVEAGSGPGPLLWHTNHGRYVSGAEPSAQGTSTARGETLEALAIPAEDPDPAWFLRVLTSAPPDGVRADPASGHRATTLCTFVADLTSGQAVLAARDDHPVTIPLRDLAEGNPPGRGRPDSPDCPPRISP